MHTVLFTHAACLDHDTGPDHPECPARLKAVLCALEDERFHLLDRREAPAARREQLLRVHPSFHIDAVAAAMPRSGLLNLDADTVLSTGSWEASLRAAGAVAAAVDTVLAGEARTAFCAVRPPGHHAEPGHAMGFCLFNNVMIGAAQARAVHGVERVAIVDFDVHHGNGTQAACAHDPGLFYVSIHQWPLYPGTGRPAECGDHGNILNVPLPPSSGSDAFREAVETDVLPALDRFRPQLLMISAGFDAHGDDPLGGLRLVRDDYTWITRRLGERAREHCGGRIVSTLEGGYDLAALASCAAAHVRELMAV